MLVKDKYLQGMCEYFSVERAKAKKGPGRMPKKKSRKGYQNMSHLPKNTWSK